MGREYLLDLDAHFIWNQDLTRLTSTCGTYLNNSQTGEKTKNLGLMKLSVDDVIESVRVNG